MKITKDTDIVKRTEEAQAELASMHLDNVILGSEATCDSCLIEVTFDSRNDIRLRRAEVFSARGHTSRKVWDAMWYCPRCAEYNYFSNTRTSDVRPLHYKYAGWWARRNYKLKHLLWRIFT